MLLPFSMNLTAQGGRDPHFFLVYFTGYGTDGTYLFDARPLEMAKAGYKENYFSDERAQTTRIKSAKGPGETLVTEVARKLQNKHQFAIVNGVHMNHRSLAHDENALYLLEGTTSKALRGFSMLPVIGGLSGASPIEAFHMGPYAPDSFRGAARNYINSIRVQLGVASKIGQDLSKGISFEQRGLAQSYLDRSLGRLRNDTNLFGQGVSMYSSGVDRLSSMEAILKNTSVASGPANDASLVNPITSDLNAMIQYMKNGLTSAGMIMQADGILDTHGVSLAEGTDRFIPEIGDRIDEIMTTLANTPYDNNRSMLDMTTVLFTSEFSRTLVSDTIADGGQAVTTGQVGTDHNPYTNTFVLAGKGINQSVILGASDLDWDAEAQKPKEVSQAHREMDGLINKAMGKPFDFQNFSVRGDLPEKYDRQDYITSSNVINTIYDLFGVSTDSWRKDGLDKPREVLKPLLSKYNSEV